MTDPHLFVERAREALDLADRDPDPQAQAALQRIAEGWLAMAKAAGLPTTAQQDG